MKYEMSWLIVVCESKNLKQVAKVISQNGIQAWADRPFADNKTHILHLIHRPKVINRVGCALIGLRASFQDFHVEVIDSSGII
jgi:hypothetical protein